eukprot:6093979-Pleurochrysis_carterae.AAC.4
MPLKKREGGAERGKREGEGEGEKAKGREQEEFRYGTGDCEEEGQKTRVRMKSREVRKEAVGQGTKKADGRKEMRANGASNGHEARRS